MTKRDVSDRKKAFSSIYDEKYWADENLSGAGSSLEATKVTREIIQKVVADYNVGSIVDVACGDFVWMPLVLERLGDHVDYIGCDIVESQVKSHAENYPQYEFRNADFVVDDIPNAELIICRDALQHLPVPDIQKALANFSASGAKYLLATTHIRRYGIRNGRNIRPGRCRDRNILLPPFNLPDPVVIYSEKYPDQHKFLGLWELPFGQ
ncbi:class I SAM-dependent methyltransferase [Pseudomonadota bacterium]